LYLRKYLTDEVLGLVEIDPESGGAKLDEKGKPIIIEPKDSDRVFVDVTAYNSKNYYVLGDVGSPGRLPVTGNETVLDAIQFAGGLIPTAAPNNIRLVRPAPPGACCEQVLPINLAAIMSGGHARRPNRRLSRPDRANDDLHRSAGRPLPDSPELDSPVLLHGPFSPVLESWHTHSNTHTHHNSHLAYPAGCTLRQLEPCV
jgi:hypothetical protein